jgi:hypothetical protein
LSLKEGFIYLRMRRKGMFSKSVREEKMLKVGI